jgi:AcrR family transcriptional regulator
MARLSRDEQRARTRSRLLGAAGRVGAHKGLERASIDEIAEEAGYTKGAFYANFESKEALFLAMLDERFAQRLAEIERVIDGDDPLAAQPLRAGEDFTRFLRADPEWERLFFAFSAHAARHEDFRRELVTRWAALREAMTRAFARVTAREGLDPHIPLDHVSLMVFAMANGFALEQLLEPEALADDLYPQMLLIFFTGLRALAEQERGTQRP